MCEDLPNMDDSNEKNDQEVDGETECGHVASFFDKGINSLICKGPEIISRDVWGAKPPSGPIDVLTTPVPYVVIHHTYIPAACYNKDDCIKAMQWMQDLHQNNRSWSDIGYNFAAGGDNRIYTGRGWMEVGAHAPKYNNKSIGIVLIGDWSNELPPLSQMVIVKQLILIGIQQGYIREDYKLIGHRQVRDTECPGEALFHEIQTWPHWVADPAGDYELSLYKEGLNPDIRENSAGDLGGEHNKLKRHNLDHFGNA